MSASSHVTLFLCTNSARPGASPALALRDRPSPLPVKWPFPAEEVVVPCTGRLQPEHLLKAFEAGADLVCVIACGEDNCHYIEGSRRARRRIDHVRGLLDEAGVGGERLLLFHLPGSAREDMAVGSGEPAAPGDAGGPAERLSAIAKEIEGALARLGASPLAREGPARLTEGAKM